VYDHPLVGKKIKDIQTGKIYNIEKVFKEFYLGWYYKVLLEIDNSHGIRFVQNITCGCEEILNGIKKFEDDYVVVDDNE
jgi:hypothetical protein